MSDFERPVFKVIEGGLMENVIGSKKKLVSAEITNSRLMGVLVMYLNWEMPENTHLKNLHQVFYFDVEENGLESYSSIIGTFDDPKLDLVEELLDARTGGLGSEFKPITEKEARYILQYYYEYNEKNGLPIPPEYPEFAFVLDTPIHMDIEERESLMLKQCVRIESPYQAINYFIMRVVAHDFIGARFLLKNTIKTNIWSEYKQGTLLRNSIKEIESETSPKYQKNPDSDDAFSTFSTLKTYQTESLVEVDGSYYLLVSTLGLDSTKITSFEKQSAFVLTASEVALMLKRQEYVNVLDIRVGAPPLTKSLTPLTKHSNVTDYESGTLYMVFEPNNNHVKKQVYLLNDDLVGLYYQVYDSQLIISSFSEEGIKILEENLQNSDYGKNLMPVSKYQFTEPIILDFIQSGYEDFEDFVDIISEP